MDTKNIRDAMVYSDKSITKRVIFANADQLCFVLNLMPGQTLPVHKHEHSSLFLNVLTGEGEVTVSGATYPLSEGGCFSVAGEDDFSVPKVSKNLSLLVVISPNPSSQYSKEVG